MEKLICSVAYFRKALYSFGKDDLDCLTFVAKARNKRNDITGILHYNQGYFLQYLEGRRESVNRTMASVELDDRHQIIQTIYFNNVESRLFDNWSMKYVDKNELQTLGLYQLLEEVFTRFSTSALEEGYIKSIAYRLIARIAVHQENKEHIRPQIGRSGNRRFTSGMRH